MHKNFLKFLSFGLIAALIFPFYANFFVEWKPGMLKFFVLGCILAGIFVGVGNYMVFKNILNTLNETVRKISIRLLNRDPGLNQRTNDLYERFHFQFIDLINELNSNETKIKGLGTHLAKGVKAIRNVIMHANSMAKNTSKRNSETAKHASINEKLLNTTIDGYKNLEQLLTSSFEKMQLFEVTFSNIISESKNIQRLTDQIEILGTNAAISAAKAGSMGADFAVVAQEVKNLAAKSRQASESIHKFIIESESETKDVLNSLKNVNSEFNQQLDNFQQTENSLINTNNTVKESLDSLSEIIDQLKRLEEISQKVEFAAQDFLRK